VEKILAVADNNKDGKISFEEFVSVSKIWSLLSTPLVSSRIFVVILLGLVCSGCRGPKKHILKIMMTLLTTNNFHK
jgi:hypothetical protein